MEDVIDYLKMIHPWYGYLILVDHSNGHDRLQFDGLNINKINIGFGGK